MTVPEKMTRQQRADRRRRIAQDVKRRRPIEEIASKYNVGLSTITNACREHGVELTAVRAARQVPRTRTGDRFLKIIVWLIEGYSTREIADDLGVTRTYVQQVKSRVEEIGLFEAIRSTGKTIPEAPDPRKLTDEQKFTMLRYLLDGQYTYKEIGEKSGMHQATVSEIAQLAKKTGLMQFARHDRTRVRTNHRSK